jgi:amino acid transporter
MQDDEDEKRVKVDVPPHPRLGPKSHQRSMSIIVTPQYDHPGQYPEEQFDVNLSDEEHSYTEMSDMAKQRTDPRLNLVRISTNRVRKPVTQRKSASSFLDLHSIFPNISLPLPLNKEDKGSEIESIESAEDSKESVDKGSSVAFRGSRVSNGNDSMVGLRRNTSLGLTEDLNFFLQADEDEVFASYKSNSPRRPTIHALLGIAAVDKKPSAKSLNIDSNLEPPPDLEPQASSAEARAEILKQGFVSFLNKWIWMLPSKEFGMWDGVVIRLIMNSFGSFIFLKLGVIFGAGGLITGTLSVILSAIVTIITALSFAAIASNGEAIAGGGLYYLLSRNVGPKIGGTVGILAALSSAVGAAVSIMTFSNALLLQFPDFALALFPSQASNIRFLSVVLLFLIVVFVLGGFSFTVRIQSVFFVIAIATMASITVGSFIYNGNSLEPGITGVSSDTVSDNIGVDFLEDYDFTKVLALTFPGFAIGAGTTLLTRLGDPPRDVSYGTVIGTLFLPFVYLFLGWIVGASATQTQLVSNASVMAILSASQVLFYLGIYVTTSSAAIISLSVAPRILQAVAKDGLFRYLKFVAKENTNLGLPLSALFLSVLLSFAVVMSGSISWIAPYVTVIQLLSYAVRVSISPLSISPLYSFRHTTFLVPLRPQ